MSEEENNEREIRVGVFVCHCGSNIGGVIDCKVLAKYAKTLPNVVHAEDNLYTCSENGLASIKNAIKEHNLNRIVVASCTPRTHEPLFRNCISEEGLNAYLFNFVNIREQCSWVHTKYPKEEAFEKAKDLIRMGVAKAIKLEPLDTVTININPNALVIGGGISGMSAALSLSRQGFKTYLVEKEEKLGGRLNSLYKLFPHDIDATEFVQKIISNVNNAQNLEIYTHAKVKNVDGFVGNFEVEIEQNGSVLNLSVGAIVVAVGSSLLTPEGMFQYDGKTRITQYQLEPKLKNNEIDAKNIAMIQCVGSRNDERLYCSSVCCMTALKNAIIIKKRNPNTNITILFRDLHSPYTYEDYYKKARKKGIIFIKYNLDRLPSVEENQIKVFNEYIGDYVIIPYDLLVLSTPLVANDDNKELAQLLKVPLEANNFFLEAHVKLRPNDFATDGIYIGGSAKWPVDITEAITQGYATASRASTILSHEAIQVEGTVAIINPEKCIGCGSCEMIYPYKAIQIERTESGSKATVISAICKGCGVCGASCPLNTISIQHFNDPQIYEQIHAVSEGLLERGV